jgi:hypothetical protein
VAVGVGLGVAIGVGDEAGVGLTDGVDDDVGATMGVGGTAGGGAGVEIGVGLDGMAVCCWQPATSINVRSNAITNTADLFMSTPPDSDAKS